MRKANEGLTRVEAVVLGVMLTLLIGLIVVVVFRRPRETINWHACPHNLQQIAKACIVYQEPNGDFFPAYWDEDCFDPMMSLALLYPDYVDTGKLFRCPDTKDKPIITVKQINGVEVKSFGPVSSKEKCSYFYDPTSHFRDIGPVQAIAADADGMTWRTPEGEKPDYPKNWQRKPRKPNHENGQNVIYFDTSVRWSETNYASFDPMDNIFCPNEGWDPDTDAYLWDGVNARVAEPAQ